MQAPLYFFWSSISMTIFYLFYLVLLKRETFFLWNRIYLLSALCLSIMLPWLDLSPLIVLPKIELMVSALSVMGDGKVIPAQKELNWLSIIYWIGVLFTAVLLWIKLLGVKRQMQSPEKRSAFSFWRTKVIDQEFTDFVAVDAHENVHVKQFHTLDILFIELIGVFFWFNPLIYCYRSSLKFIHEYLADEYAAKFAKNKKEYAMMLFLQNFKAGPALSNSFYTPLLLEARIRMLQRKGSNAYRLWKYVLYIPLIVLIMLMCSFSTSYFNGSMNETDQAANFRGGFEAFSKYLIKTARKVSNKNGKVMVSFVVETNGEVTNEKVESSLDGASDKEALRIIKSSPKWEPALQNGEEVRSAYQIGINF
ncbi:M56 family metallopeptidase [Pedobacter metabolipauper]|uniref:Outer membrane transport energization protein TonB n=1 Tax=Pedobacter metabolipauper TaxID=425513 RepID=A0A4R6SUP4_9SPHI|nr:M56 family metallopeptidase [Pedobacter metabolipauper]TDQ08450.1 outer membrane transport energization protein TonB [Pedobacter metabolipauper]